MSLSLFNAVPAGAIEVLSDAENQPWFKRADLGRFLELKYLKDVYRDVDTISRKRLCERGRVQLAPSQTQNDHDAFVNLEAALEIVVRSKKPKAVELTKWLTRKGVEKVVEVKQKTIEEKDSQLALLNDDLTQRDTQIQQLEYDNVGLQGEIRAKDEEIHRRQEELHAERHMV